MTPSPPVGPVMSPRLGLIACDATGFPALPQAVPDGAGGAIPVWDHYYPCDVGGCPAREYRDASDATRLFVVVVLAAPVAVGHAAYALAVCWVPSDARDGGNAAYDALIAHPAIAPGVAAQWPVETAPTGELVSPALDADATPAGSAARDAWPPAWRLRLATDDPGDALADPPVPAALPTGPRCLGAVLA